MSNTLGPAQLVTGKPRRRWPGFVFFLCLLMAIVTSFDPYGDALVAAIFFLVCALPFGYLWIRERGALSTLRPVQLLAGPRFWRRWWGLAGIVAVGTALTHGAVQDVIGLLSWLLILGPIGCYVIRRRGAGRR